MNQSKWEKTSYLVLERINSEEHVLQEQSPEMFCKKRCSEKFRKIHMPQPATLLKKRLAQVFSFEFCEISKNTFFTEHLWTIKIQELKIEIQEIQEPISSLIIELLILLRYIADRISVTDSKQFYITSFILITNEVITFSFLSTSSFAKFLTINIFNKSNTTT